jgi:hypothetical protein
MKTSPLIYSLLFSCAVFATPAVQAGDFYVLASTGNSQTDGSSATATALKLQAGVIISPNLFLEGGYVDAGSQTYRFGSINVNSKTTGASIAFLAVAPLAEKFSAFAKLGYNTYSSSVSVLGYSGSGSGTTSGALYGAGGILKLTESVGLRLEYEKIASDTSLTTVGVQYKF